MAIITSRADIDHKLGGPTPAEARLIDTCVAGENCVLADGTLPSEGDHEPNRLIRAEVLRYLILGGCQTCPVQGWGVQLSGAYVIGRLDLSYQAARGATTLARCRFDNDIVALQSSLATLSLDESAMAGLNAERAQVTGSVFLRRSTTKGEVRFSGATIGGEFNCEGATLSGKGGPALGAQGLRVARGAFLRGVQTSGEVNISGARIGGQLTFTGATMTNAAGRALNAQRAQVTGRLSLRNATTRGEVSLSGARIGGQLACGGATLANGDGAAMNAQGVQVTGDVFLREATITGETRFSGAVIGGAMTCEAATLRAARGKAFNAQSAKMEGGFVWRDGATCPSGILDFTAAHMSNLVDDLACWPTDGRVWLDGLTYDRLPRDLDVKARLRWLANGSDYNSQFRPQPYTQLAQIYRAMGRDSDARTVLFEREQRERWDQRRRTRIVPDGNVSVGIRSLGADWVNANRWIWDQVVRLTIGYGYRPFRPIAWLVALWLIGVVMAHFAWITGTFAPNSGPIQVSPGWQALITCAADCPENPAAAWSAKTQQGQDWETFNRYAYATDLVIPLIDLGQTDAWVPSPNRGVWGWRLWAGGFVLHVLGWVITALGAAALTGVIQKERA